MKEHRLFQVTFHFEEAASKEDADINILWAEGAHGDQYEVSCGVRLRVCAGKGNEWGDREHSREWPTVLAVQKWKSFPSI